MGKNLLDEALKYIELRWNLFPCHGFDEKMSCTCSRGHDKPQDAGKHPALKQLWNELSSRDPYDIKGWWADPEPGKKYSKNEFIPNPDYNIALHCLKSGLFVIDIDPRGGGDSSYEKLIQILDEKGINLPETVESLTGSYMVDGKSVRGRHIYFKCGTGESLVGNLKSLGLPGIDIKYRGYVMLPPSKHFSGTNYEWFEGRDPFSIPVAEAPEELLEIVRQKRDHKGTKLGQLDWNEIETQAEKIDIKKLFKDGLIEGERNVGFYRVAVATALRFSPRNGEIDDFMEEAIVAAMLWYNATKVDPPLPEEGTGGAIYQTRRAVNFVRDNPPGLYLDPSFMDWVERQELIKLDHEQVTKILGNVSEKESDYSKQTRMLISQAMRDGKSVTEAISRDNVDIPDDPDAISIEEGGVPGKRTLSDLGNARRLVDNFGEGIAYTPDLGYKVWKDGYWKSDKESLVVQELAKRLPSIIKAESKDDEDNAKSYDKWSHMSRSNARIRATLDGAKSDPRIYVDIDDWDKDPELFGVRNGVVNLRTGEFMPNAPSLRISMKSPIPYIPGYQNDFWEKFLNDITGGDEEYKKFLQRLVGYSITGYSNLDILPLMYGPPGTGKNTFIESIVKAAGEYSWPLDLSVISESNGMSSNSDLYHIAELFNKRISWVDELPEGERLKENTMKKLSGSSLMSARSPGGRPFSFFLKAKTWLSTNHRPPITDEAMWRRIIALPFTQIPKTIDPHLKEYLAAEEKGQPAVLAWMVEGAMDYINNPAPGINPIGFSRVVFESTEVYKKSEDKLGTFIEDELAMTPGISTPLNSIYARYTAWCMKRGERTGTMQSLQKQLIDKRISVEGFGASAQVVDYTIKGVSDSPSTQINWGTDYSGTTRSIQL